MKVLVTGATGFMGTFLCKYLESNKNYELIKLNSKNCDLTKENSLSNYNDISYDYIYHLAAWTQAGDFCLKHPGEQWIINQQINTNVLVWWKENQPTAKLICMGTSCSYDPALQLIEDEYMNGLPIESLFTYAMTKRMLYAGLLSINNQFKQNYMYLVPSTLYGPSYHTDDRQMHFIFDLIHKIILGNEYGKEVKLWGDGYQKRELVYIDDFIKIAVYLSENYNNDIINIGAGEEYTIRDFAKIISDYLGYDANNITYDESKYVGAKSKLLNVNKLQSLSGKKLKYTSLSDGLENTINWFLENKKV